MKVPKGYKREKLNEDEVWELEIDEPGLQKLSKVLNKIGESFIKQWKAWAIGVGSLAVISIVCACVFLIKWNQNIGGATYVYSEYLGGYVLIDCDESITSLRQLDECGYS